MEPVLQMFALMVASSLLQSAASLHLNNTIFAVTVSSQVKGGSQETLCAHIHGPTEPVIVTVTLNVETSRTVVLEEAVKQDFYRCVTFQVPLVLAKAVGTVTVAVKGEMDSMSKTTKVLVQPSSSSSSLHIIQTDKPIYKPGQTVRFRIVSLDASFLPLNRVV
ncbi:hypothetical protein LDENG_00240610, partial [Lucifuga dentata]